MPVEQTSDTQEVPIFTGYRELGRANNIADKTEREEAVLRTIGGQITQFLRINRPLEGFLSQDDIFTLGARNQGYNQRAYRFFQDLHQRHLLNDEQRRILNRFGVPPEMVPPPTTPREWSERSSPEATVRNVRHVLAEEDQAIENLIDSKEKVAARSRLGRTFARTSQLIRDLTVIPRGARVTEPKKRWHPKSRQGRLINFPQALWNFLPDRLDERLTLAAAQAEAEGDEKKATKLRLISALGVKGSKLLAETGIRLAVAVPFVQSTNALLSSTEVGTLPHAVSLGIIAGLALLTRGIPKINRDSWQFAGKIALRGVIGGSIAYGGYLLAEGVARSVGTSVAQTITPENFSWNLLGTVALGTAATRSAAGWTLGKIGNISGWTEDLIQDRFNRQEMATEVSRYAYLQAIGTLFPSAYGSDAEQLAQTECRRKDGGLIGRKKGWGGLATYELSKDRPEDLSPDIVLQAAQELRACKTALEVRLDTNPTRYRTEYYWDDKKRKHVIGEKIVNNWLNAKMGDIMALAIKQNWEPERVAENLGLTLVIGEKIMPKKSPQRQAFLVHREAKKMSRATLTAYVLGGAALGAGWKTLAGSKELITWFHDAAGQALGPEVPIDLSRAVASRAGRLAVELGAPETLSQQPLAVSQETQRLANLASRVKLLGVARENFSQNATEGATLIRDSGFASLAEMDNFYATLQRSGISYNDLEVIFQAAARSSRPDPWISGLDSSLAQTPPNQIAPLARELLKSENLRQDLSHLVQQNGLTPEIERILSNNGRIPSGERTRALLSRIGLSLDDPAVQLSYLGLQEKTGALQRPAVIQEFTDGHGKAVKLVTLGARSPVVLEITPDQTQTAEQALIFMQRMATCDPTEFERASNNQNVDFGRFVALAYEAQGQNSKAVEALAGIQHEIQVVAKINHFSLDDRTLDAFTKGDPAAFNKVAPLFRDASKKYVREFTGGGIAPGATSVLFWQSILDKASQQDALDRSAYYFRHLPELETPRIAASPGLVEEWTKGIVEAGTPPISDSPTLGEIVQNKLSLDHLGYLVYPENLRPIPVIQGEQIIRRDWQGIFFIDKPAYSDTLKRALIATEGAGITAEPTGINFLKSVAARNLILGQRSGGSGLTTQIVDWLQNGKIGRRILGSSAESNSREYTLEFAARLAGAIAADQVPPEMAPGLGLPTGEIIPPVKLPTGLGFDQVYEKIKTHGIGSVVNQLRQRVIAQVLGKIYTDNEVADFWLRYEPLGNVGGYQIRGFEAGARLFFGKTSEELTIPQQAGLLGLAQGTDAYSPIWHPDEFVARTKYMLSHYYLPRGLITPQQNAEFQQYLESGAVQAEFRKRFPISDEGKIIDPQKISAADWGLIYNPKVQPEDIANPAARAIKVKGARMIQMPPEFTNPTPETIRTITAADGFIAPDAPTNVIASHKLVQQALGAKRFHNGLVSLPLSSTETAELPTITLPWGKGEDIRPGLSVIIVDDKGNVLENFNPSGVLGPEVLVEPGSATKPLLLSAMIKALGVDPNKPYPAWKGSWSLDGSNLDIQNPPIYAGQNSPRAAGYFYMSLAEVLRGGGSANVPFNAAFRETLNKDPDAWRKVTAYLKTTYNITLYDGKGQELFFPPATLTNIRVQQGAFVAANARILSDPNNPVTKILGDDSSLGKAFKVGPNPNEVWKLSPSEVTALKSGGIAKKSGTQALGETGVGAMSYLERIIGKDGKSRTVFIFAKGQSLVDGQPTQVNLERQYGRGKAYAGIFLVPLAKKLATTLQQ